MESVTTCPLGSKCEEIIDNKLHKCAWFTKMAGTDAQGNQHDDEACAIAWMPILQLEVATTSRGVASSVQSLRNAQDTRQSQAIDALKRIDNA